MAKKKFTLLLSTLALLTLACLSGQATACTATGYTRDNTNLTAAVINPVGTVSGDVDASGCDIGVYYGANATGAVVSATIHDARYFGIVVNGDDGPASVDVRNSTISAIRDTPFDGAQHGIGIYYRACKDATSSATGSISGNTVSDYQKGGIVATCAGTAVQISDNVVAGRGPTGVIAQNGIEVGFGASASVMRNTVSKNQYTGSSTYASGILVVGGPYWCNTYPSFCPSFNTTGTQIVKNVVTDNDGGIVVQDVAGSGADYEPPSTQTNVKVINNTISDADCSNLIYQAGISDMGDNDKLIHNAISGLGYDATLCDPSDATPANGGGAFAVDDSYTNLAKVHANVIGP